MDKNIEETYATIKDKAYSITEFETYVKCPYQYFLKNIIKLPEKIESEYGMSPLESGNLFHIILYRFFTKLRAGFIQENVFGSHESNNGLPTFTPIELIEENHENYLDEIRKIAVEELDKIKFDHPFFDFQSTELLGTDRKIGLIETWLLCEYQRKKDNFLAPYKPILFELGFGFQNKYNPNSLPAIEIANGLKIRGKIDRIEWDTETKFVIADYKSSGNYLATAGSIKSGESFQIPLYMLAAQTIFKDSYNLDLEPSAGAYYILKPKYVQKIEKSGYESHKLIQTSDAMSISQMIDIATQGALNIIRNINEGNFPVKPKKGDQTCQNCSYSGVCRINSLKRIS